MAYGANFGLGRFKRSAGGHSGPLLYRHKRHIDGIWTSFRWINATAPFCCISCPVRFEVQFFAGSSRWCRYVWLSGALGQFNSIFDQLKPLFNTFFQPEKVMLLSGLFHGISVSEYSGPRRLFPVTSLITTSRIYTTTFSYKFSKTLLLTNIFHIAQQRYIPPKWMYM